MRERQWRISDVMNYSIQAGKGVCFLVRRWKRLDTCAEGLCLGGQLIWACLVDVLKQVPYRWSDRLVFGVFILLGTQVTYR